MKKIVKYVGLDVHKDSITIAFADDDRGGDVCVYEKKRNRPVWRSRTKGFSFTLMKSIFPQNGRWVSSILW